MKTNNKRQKRLLTLDEVSELLDLPVCVILHMVINKEIPGAVKIGKTLQFESSVINDWIDDGAITEEECPYCNH